MTYVLKFFLVGTSAAFLFAAGHAPTVLAQEDARIEAANEAFYDAFSRQSSADMAQLWADGARVRMIGPRARAITEGAEAVREAWAAVFERFDEISISMPDPHVRTGTDIAWVVGLEEVTAVRSNGETMRASVMATNVFEKHEGVWRMVHHHASLPVQ